MLINIVTDLSALYDNDNLPVHRGVQTDHRCRSRGIAAAGSKSGW